MDVMTGDRRERWTGAAIMTIALLLAGSAALSGCATPSDGGAQGYRPMSLLVFGDHGYHMDYLDPDDTTPPRTRDQFLAAEREEWIADKRPPAEFAPSPMYRLPDTGGYVAASGMAPVAHAMKAWCAQQGCDAAVMLGDNVYPDGPTGGADGKDDATRFEKILRTPYEDLVADRPGFRIYAALGNHDWHTSREAALSEVRYLETTLPFYMDGIAYSVKPPAGHGEVEVFVVDTHILLGGTTVYEDILADDGSEVATTEVAAPDAWATPQTEAERQMVQTLERKLRQSTARWKVVVGHHPLWSSAGSKFEQARALRKLLLPTLCKYADMYLAGHEHTLEVHTDSCAQAVPGAHLPPLPEVVSGAASKQRPLNTAFTARQARKYPELKTSYAKGMVWGYAYIAFGRDSAALTMISTPADGSGANVIEHRERFRRRSSVER
jgi:hypothetical protein